MTRDNEIPAIFNPRRVRAPSVVVTNDSPNGSLAGGGGGGGGFTNILHSSNPQISRSDSISQPNDRNIDGNPNTNVTPTAATTTAVAVTTAASTTNITTVASSK